MPKWAYLVRETGLKEIVTTKNPFMKAWGMARGDAVERFRDLLTGFK